MAERRIFVVMYFTFYSIGTPSDIIKLSILFGYILTTFAIVDFIVAWGLLKGKEWAGKMAVVLVIVSFILGVVGIGLLVTDDNIAYIGAEILRALL